MTKVVPSDYAQMLLNGVAKQLHTTMYEVKHRPLREYQKQLWRNPAYKFDAQYLGDFA